MTEGILLFIGTIITGILTSGVAYMTLRSNKKISEEEKDQQMVLQRETNGLDALKAVVTAQQANSEMLGAQLEKANEVNTSMNQRLKTLTERMNKVEATNDELQAENQRLKADLEEGAALNAEVMALLLAWQDWHAAGQHGDTPPVPEWVRHRLREFAASHRRRDIPW